MLCTTLHSYLLSSLGLKAQTCSARHYSSTLPYVLTLLDFYSVALCSAHPPLFCEGWLVDALNVLWGKVDALLWAIFQPVNQSINQPPLLPQLSPFLAAGILNGGHVELRLTITDWWHQMHAACDRRVQIIKQINTWGNRPCFCPQLWILCIAVFGFIIVLLSCLCFLFVLIYLPLYLCCFLFFNVVVHSYEVRCNQGRVCGRQCHQHFILHRCYNRGRGSNKFWKINKWKMGLKPPFHTSQMHIRLASLAKVQKSRSSWDMFH